MLKESKHLGTFKTAEEAALAYNERARQLGKPLNDVPPVEAAEPAAAAQHANTDAEMAAAAHAVNDDRPPQKKLRVASATSAPVPRRVRAGRGGAPTVRRCRLTSG